jgi:hypothetical protein
MEQPAPGPPAPAEASDTPSGPASGKVQRAFLAGAALLAASAAAAWSTALLLMSHRGFDITDEGYYLLSYQWWRTNLRAGVGSQYVYGPIYSLLHHDIAALRDFRLASVLLACAFLGWAFMRWLRLQRPDATRTKLWELAGTLAVTASGGVTLAWLPLSPGYNDATALGAVVGTALVFVIAHHADDSAGTHRWAFLALGGVGFVLVLIKWTTAPAVAVLLTAAAVVVAGRGRVAAIRLIGWFAAGFVATGALFHVLVIRLDDAIPPMLDVTRLSNEGGDHRVGTVLTTYLDSSRDLARDTLHGHAALFAVTLVVALVPPPASRRRWYLAVGAFALAVAFGLSARSVVNDRGLHGGPTFLPQFGPTLLALSIVVALAAAGSTVRTLRRPPPASAWLPKVALPLMLLVLPFLQALGTNVRLWSMAQNAFACWMALLIWLLTSLDRRSTLARGAAAVSIAALLVAIPVISSDGLLNHPYRAAPYEANTTAMPVSSPLRGLRLPRSDVREYVALREALRPQLRPAPAPMLALDKMPGLILLLGGRPVGEAWTGPTATVRSAAGLVDECRRRLLREPPILLYNRPPATRDQEALAACGYHLRRDYRVLPVTGGPPGVQVYVPR